MALDLAPMQRRGDLALEDGAPPTFFVEEPNIRNTGLLGVLFRERRLHWIALFIDEDAVGLWLNLIGEKPL